MACFHSNIFNMSDFSILVDLLKVKLIGRVLINLNHYKDEIALVCFSSNTKLTDRFDMLQVLQYLADIKNITCIMFFEFFHRFKMPIWGIFCYITACSQLRRTTRHGRQSKLIYAFSFKHNAFRNTLTKIYNKKTNLTWEMRHAVRGRHAGI